MRVLAGCEENGKVREAFAARGHDAWSCDILPTRLPGQHLQMDIYEALMAYGPWDVIILHPDCTTLTVAGNGTYGINKDESPKERHHERIEAIEWTVKLWDTAKKEARIGAALENPVGVLPRKRMGKPTYIHPWQFGHKEQKKTCLWLDRLPPLTVTDDVYDEMMLLPVKERQKIWYMSPGDDRKRLRSETYDGWADAMALQWGALDLI
jgi:hypothetical protein